MPLISRIGAVFLTASELPRYRPIFMRIKLPADDSSGQNSAKVESKHCTGDAAGCGLALDAKRAPHAHHAPHEDVHHPSCITRDGSVWQIDFGGGKLTMPHLKGFIYIAELLRQPGRSCSSEDLSYLGNLPDGGHLVAHTARQDAHEANPVGAVVKSAAQTDRRSLAEYKSLIADYDADILEAQRLGWVGEVEALEKQKQSLIEHVAKLTGLRGRVREQNSDHGRARRAVQKAIKEAILKISAKCPELGQHLSKSIRTGYDCSYHPAPEIVWKVKYKS